MLTILLSSKRKHVTTAVIPIQQQQHPRHISNQQVVVDAFNQKDLLIKEEFRKAHYKTGDIVRPVRTEDFENWGYGLVRGIVSQYKDWPVTEPFPEAPKKPMIVLVESFKKNEAFNCTVNYIRSLTAEEKELIKND